MMIEFTVVYSILFYGLVGSLFHKFFMATEHQNSLAIYIINLLFWPISLICGMILIVVRVVRKR